MKDSSYVYMLWVIGDYMLIKDHMYISLIV